MTVRAFKTWPFTGTGAISSSVTPDHPLSLICVKLHLSAAGGAAEDFAITVNSVKGTAYDCLLFAQDMETVTDILWVPEQPIPILNNDVLDFTYTNTNGRTWGLEVTTEREDY